MTTSGGDVDRALSDALEGLRQELAATNVLISGLGHELEANRVETAVRVEGLRAEQKRERRVRFMFVGMAGIGGVYAVDEHIEHCSPGSRITKAIQAQDRGVKDQKELKAIYDHPPGTFACDVSFPLHSHSASSYPTQGNVLGLVILAVVVLGVSIYHRIASVMDFGRVEQAARLEKREDGVA